LVASGRRPYVVGPGGSSPVGCLGYAACAAEIRAQEQNLALSFGRIIVPNGSSGTHAGLAAGLTALDDAALRVLSFTVLAPWERSIESTQRLAAETFALLGPDQAGDEIDIVVSGSALGEGYGVPTAAMFEAVRLVARTEGLLLDPVYGGEAFAGLLAAIRSEKLGDAPVLF